MRDMVTVKLHYKRGPPNRGGGSCKGPSVTLAGSPQGGYESAEA